MIKWTLALIRNHKVTKSNSFPTHKIIRFSDYVMIRHDTSENLDYLIVRQSRKIGSIWLGGKMWWKRAQISTIGYISQRDGLWKLSFTENFLHQKLPSRRSIYATVKNNSRAELNNRFELCTRGSCMLVSNTKTTDEANKMAIFCYELSSVWKKKAVSQMLWSFIV